ncbi:MAG TPA: hypothetical protein VGG40_11470 [Solirubrobacterales bacterium]|jgi:hypothetical protein
MKANRLLGIYLNDHLAGATVGVELARRSRSNNSETPPFGAALARICGEIEEDRETLKAVMAELGVRRDPLKPALAWIGEKAGRLKPNGRLIGYSPLSRLLELEMLHIGITGKRQLWGALDGLEGGIAGFDFKALAARAEGQRDVVEDLHRQAAALALSVDSDRED